MPIKVIQPKIDGWYRGEYNVLVIKYKHDGRYFMRSQVIEQAFTYHLGSEVLKQGVQTVYVYKGVSGPGFGKINEAVCRLNGGKKIRLEKILAS